MKMKNELRQIVWIIGILLTIGALFLGVPIMTTDVMGANRTNDTTIAKVYVWNTEPNITKIVVSPSPTIDLTAGNTTTVNCTAYVWDYNSYADVRVRNATFYEVNYKSDQTVDNNYRYVNDTCADCTVADASGTNATCTCSFTVEYYANNGTWECNMTIMDQGVNITDNNRNFTFNDSLVSDTVTINTVLGINTPAEIDYGNLSVTETSSNISANITNWGNVPINVSVRGWGGQEDYTAPYANVSMVCAYGNISTGYQRYSANISMPYANMANLTNTSVGIPNLDLPVRQNDDNYGNDTNATYWRIQIPLTVGGNCNGTVLFSATDTS